MKIKKGDHVIVLAGKDKGATGQVIAAFPATSKVVVEGVNMIKKNKKVTNPGGRSANEGGIVTQEAPIHVSNVAARRPGDQDAASRVGYKINEDGTKVRVLRPSGQWSDGDLRGASARPRLKEKYRTKIASALKDEFGYANVMQIPGLTKIIVNMGVGEAARDAKLIEGAVRDLTVITGQKPAVVRAPVHRPVQAARGHADRRARHAPWRPDVGVPRPAALAGAAPYP